MNGQQLFEVWSPADSVWSRWVKPVLFADGNLPDVPPTAEEPWQEVEPPGDRSTAVVVDLPGWRSVDAGLSLARAGFRPVPLYNTSWHPAALIDVRPIVRRLIRAAEILPTLWSLSPDAPPAFLLDADRLAPGQSPNPGRFDNRWVTFPQDFPSANFLRSRGLSRVLVIRDGQSPVPEDLAHVLLRWKEAGVELYWRRPDVFGFEPLEVSKPSRFRQISYRALTLVGFRRNSAGGFGSLIPVPSQGGSGIG